MGTYQASVLLIAVCYTQVQWSLAIEKCFFDSSLTCPEYCCREHMSFDEYCCDDCNKSRNAHSCTNIGMIIGIAFGVLVAIAVIGGFIALCVLGCICTGLTGRTRYQKNRGRPVRNVRQQPNVAFINSAGGYPVNNYPTVQTRAFADHGHEGIPPPPYPDAAYPPTAGVPCYPTVPVHVQEGSSYPAYGGEFVGYAGDHGGHGDDGGHGGYGDHGGHGDHGGYSGGHDHGGGHGGHDGGGGGGDCGGGGGGGGGDGGGCGGGGE